MDLESLSIESISAWKQSQVHLEAQVALLKKANDHNKTTGANVVELIKASEPGKGTRLDVTA